MKEFVYTCENCGSEYTITDPGQYQCQSCNNTFTVEDQEQKQAERLEQIRRKAEAQAETQAIEKTQEEEEKKKKRDLFIWKKLPFIFAAVCSVVTGLVLILFNQSIIGIFFLILSIVPVLSLFKPKERPRKAKTFNTGLNLIRIITVFFVLAIVFKVSLYVEDIKYQKKRDHLKILKENYIQSKEKYFEDISNIAKAKRYDEDFAELMKYQKEYGYIPESRINGTDIILSAVSLIFCIIFLELYTMIQTIYFNTRKGE